jgi:hypothetical protein
MELRSGNSKISTRCKPGSEWNEDDLQYYRIIITDEEYSAFFEEDRPVDFYKDDIRTFLSYNLSSVTVQQDINWFSISKGPKNVMTVIKDLIAVTKTHRFEECAVDDLAKSILQLFDYDDGDRAIRTRKILDLDMAKGRTQATPDICIETMELSIKLLVQEDKSYNVGNDRHLMGNNPEAQLIAEAVAAFQENIKIYKRVGKQNVPEYQLMPGITMLGTCPTFYLIPISASLSECIKYGIEPTVDTLVKRYKIPGLPINVSDAMLSPKHARIISECYQSFRKYAV